MKIGDKIKEIQLTNLVPADEYQFKMLQENVSNWCKNKQIVPPLLQDDLVELTSEYVIQNNQFLKFQKLIAVLINNYSWKSVVERIPFQRRILLLPQCLKNSEYCNAPVDELGLICQNCGRCSIPEIIEKAEEKGYHVIVSEGTGAVSMLLESGKIECVIGVGCLDSLERTFPLTTSQAIPSIAVPLFDSDCKDSKLYINWLYEILDLDNTRLNGHVSFEMTKQKVKSWFTTKNLKSILNCKTESELLAVNWLAQNGKRWRPIIMMNTFESLPSQNNYSEESIMKLAIAVECFHKASLIHDDIEDNDEERYDEATMHSKYGTPVAINTGDLLIGFGYQLIAESGVGSDMIRLLLKVASKGHRELCLGQGKELLAVQNNEILDIENLLDVFEKKTSPAFEVAFQFGLIISGYYEELSAIISNYSRLVGIAYQIKDDLEDFNTEKSNNDIDKLRPSLVLSILNEKYNVDFQNRISAKESSNLIYDLAVKNNVINDSMDLLNEFKAKAFIEIKQINYPQLKIFLARIINKMTQLKTNS